MKILLTTLLFLLLNLNLSAQNLVPNPSFEDTVGCPIGGMGHSMDKVVGWENYGNSPDYYNACAPAYDGSVPLNGVGFQYAATGNAYCGFITYCKGVPTPTCAEFIGSQLSSPLSIGTKYYVSLKVNLTAEPLADLCCATNKIGVLFSTKAYSEFILPPINNFAHIYSDFIITDTIMWTFISGSFIADSAYQHIIIGNFFDTINMNIMSINDSLYFAYYYVDDICVSEDSVACNSTVGIYEPNFSKDIYVYPNPSKGKELIRITSRNFISSIEIYNISGKLIISKKPKANFTEFFMPELANGMYLIKVTTGEQLFYHKLIHYNH